MTDFTDTELPLDNTTDTTVEHYDELVADDRIRQT